MSIHEHLKIYTNNIEGTALNQVYELSKHPAFIDSRIRVMPDVHAGKGCVIGFTADYSNKYIIPNVVGVDIGCGVLVYTLGKIDINYSSLDDFIKENIPSGMNTYQPEKSEYGSQYNLIKDLLCFKKLSNIKRLECSLGTLGGSNHFIEIDQDEEGNKYLLIHTGSRNLGKQVAEIYQEKAIYHCHEEMMKNAINKIIQDLKAQGKQCEIENTIKKYKNTHQYSMPSDLCYLEGQDVLDYLHDMKICQTFANYNRQLIGKKIVEFLGQKFDVNKFFTSMHNYIDGDYIRKGAISAKKDEPCIVPLNMRDGALICRGKGNLNWNYSAPHGAGRQMSRSEAKKSLSVDEFQEQMEGIFTTTANQSTIDESPMAYKSAQEIIDLITETVEIEKIIKPVYNFKAGE